MFYFIFLSVLTIDTLANKVLPPIKEGEDVGIVIVSGGNLYYYQYEELGLAIQEASSQRLWVQLSNNDLLYEEELSRRTANDTVLGQGVQALRDAGLPNDAPVIAYGHSYGGVMAIDEVQAYPELVSGLVLIGVAPNRPWYYDTPPAHTEAAVSYAFPVPTMLANGDLDGNVRVTQTMNTFRQVKDNVENGDGSYKTRYAHAVLPGVNHMAYVTGNYSGTADRYWINSEVTGDEGRAIVAETTVSFIVYHSSMDSSAITEAEADLEQLYRDTDDFMAPLLSAFHAERDESGEFSPWAIEAQYIIANLDEDQAASFTVNNSLVPKGDLRSQQAYIDSSKNGTSVVTYTTLSGYPYCWLYQAACMMEAKAKSSEAIHGAVTAGEHEGVVNDTELFCRDVNLAAFQWVWTDLVPDLHKERFLGSNVSVQFLQDEFLSTEAHWLASELVFDYNGEELQVQSQNFITRLDDPEVPGMHHCKLLSPARAIEFIYVDALYENMYG